MLTRCASYICTIKTPKPPSEYTQILVTFQQRQENLVTTTETELDFEETDVVVKLTQEETALLSDEHPCLLQIRCYKGPYDAPASAVWKLKVNPALDNRILGGGEEP